MLEEPVFLQQLKARETTVDQARHVTAPYAAAVFPVRIPVYPVDWG